jgi:2-polyprenyl-3-methyl-5-hydroxy-6-metoxy-1,4-benzoquinol methylase
VVPATVRGVEGREPEHADPNLAWWQEAAAIHAASDFYDLEAIRGGRDRMRPYEIGELGVVTGLDLVHLQCHIGTDTVSWARRGARVVGLDYSSNSLDVARRLAEDCDLPIEFVCSDVHDAPRALGHRRFDVVYTGIGALNWLPDLGPWARVVSELIRTDGHLYLSEIHPLVFGLADDGRTLVRDIVAAGFEPSDRGTGTYAQPDAPMANRITCERTHSIGEVITAVLEAGLVIELFREHRYSNAPWPWTVRDEDGFHRLPSGWPQYPLAYSLRARKVS